MDHPTITQLTNAVSDAIQQFSEGRPQAFQDLWSHRDDVTILGAFGGSEIGWSVVGPRIAWASSQFEDGSFLGYEPISIVAGSDMAYMVAIERTQAVIGGGGPPVIQELRVTQIFRREEAGWRMVHRHADALTSKAPPKPALDTAAR